MRSSPPVKARVWRGGGTWFGWGAHPGRVGPPPGLGGESTPRHADFLALYEESLKNP